MRIGIFGFGQPLGLFAALGLETEDVTLAPSEPCPRVAGFIEPFMDPFAASLLHRLASGALDGLAALVFLRESPGAVHAFHYACEFERRGLLPATAPRLVLLNLVASTSDAAERFNLSETDRLVGLLREEGWRPVETGRETAAVLADLEAGQSAARVSGAAAFALRGLLPGGESEVAAALSEGGAAREGPRIALLGAPLGNAALHARLDAEGVLALDQQGLDQRCAAEGGDVASALAAQAENPFAARQPRDLYVPAVAAALEAHRIDRVVWQVDTHDDLWGWLAPQVRAAAEARGAEFLDLGFLPRWPGDADLAALEVVA